MSRKNKENKDYIKRAKQEALAQWRGIDLTEEERALEKTEKQVADVVKNVFEKIKFEERRSQAEVINVWKNALDPLIVAHTQPIALKNGVLIVYVDNSVWLNEINSFWKQDILLKLQSAFGKTMIKNIYFTIG